MFVSERDCYIGAPLESQTTNPNYQLTITWRHNIYLLSFGTIVMCMCFAAWFVSIDKLCVALWQRGCGSSAVCEGRLEEMTGSMEWFNWEVDEGYPLGNWRVPNEGMFASMIFRLSRLVGYVIVPWKVCRIQPSSACWPLKTAGSK